LPHTKKLDAVDDTWVLTSCKNCPFIRKCGELYAVVSGVCTEIV